MDRADRDTLIERYRAGVAAEISARHPDDHAGQIRPALEEHGRQW
jgi:hypothetical protein